VISLNQTLVQKGDFYMEQLFSLISSYGFPMVLSIYLLLRLETLIRGLKESIDTLIILSNVESAELRRLKKEKKF
jgi:hypothetical protein